MISATLRPSSLPCAIEEVELERHAVLHQDAVGVLGRSSRPPPGARAPSRGRTGTGARSGCTARCRACTGPVASRASPRRTPSISSRLLIAWANAWRTRRSAKRASLQVHAEVDVDVRRVLVLVVRLAEGRILGLPLELERGELGAVHALGLQLQKGRRRARDDAIDHARDVRPAAEVVGIGDQDDLSPGLPLLEQVGPGSHRIAPGSAAPREACRRGRTTPAGAWAASRCSSSGAPWRWDACSGCAPCTGPPPRTDSTDLKSPPYAARRLRIDHRLVGEDDVGGRERLLVVPAHVPAQLEREVEAVAAVSARTRRARRRDSGPCRT